MMAEAGEVASWFKVSRDGTARSRHPDLFEANVERRVD